MNTRGLIGSLIATAVVVAVILAWVLAFGARPRLGLDLRGGISVILTPIAIEGADVPDDVLDQTIEILRSRVDSLGVAEPEIARQGSDIVVQLPGIEDRERALEIIGKTAKLTFRPVQEVFAPGTPQYEAEGPDCTSDDPRPDGPVPDDAEIVVCGESPPDNPETAADEATQPPLKYRLGPAALTGEGVADALATVEQTGQGGFTNTWIVQLDLTSDGARKFAEITGELACIRDQAGPGAGRLAIVLDDVVRSDPEMNPSVQCGVGITGGGAIITVGGGEQDARDLALVLRTGALPITLEPSTASTVSPTLGAQSLRAGIIAGLIGLALVAVFVVSFYRWLGAVALTALMVFGVILVGLITLLGEVGFTLTLAGIAGVIVSIGIAADSSILYFERLRDELDTGKTVRTSVVRAFRPAFRTNLTGNTVTIAAAIILYFLAVGPVRGFAFTLGVATALDLVILLGFTRPAVQLLGRTRLISRSTVRAATEPQLVGGSR
ncbi:MAG: protein translocase subunit SecD [Actinomycetota bacterium]|nr:protein translocase subunit SecD [Actinomycetota bacterium]